MRKVYSIEVIIYSEIKETSNPLLRAKQKIAAKKVLFFFFFLDFTLKFLYDFICSQWLDLQGI